MEWIIGEAPWRRVCSFLLLEECIAVLQTCSLLQSSALKCIHEQYGNESDARKWFETSVQRQITLFELREMMVSRVFRLPCGDAPSVSSYPIPSFLFWRYAKHWKQSQNAAAIDYVIQRVSHSLPRNPGEYKSLLDALRSHLQSIYEQYPGLPAPSVLGESLHSDFDLPLDSAARHIPGFALILAQRRRVSVQWDLSMNVFFPERLCVHSFYYDPSSKEMKLHELGCVVTGFDPVTPTAEEVQYSNTIETFWVACKRKLRDSEREIIDSGAFITHVSLPERVRMIHERVCHWEWLQQKLPDEVAKHVETTLEDKKAARKRAALRRLLSHRWKSIAEFAQDETWNQLTSRQRRKLKSTLFAAQKKIDPDDETPHDIMERVVRKILVALMAPLENVYRNAGVFGDAHAFAFHPLRRRDALQRMLMEQFTSDEKLLAQVPRVMHSRSGHLLPDPAAYACLLGSGIEFELHLQQRMLSLVPAVCKLIAVSIGILDRSAKLWKDTRVVFAHHGIAVEHDAHVNDRRILGVRTLPEWPSESVLL